MLEKKVAIVTGATGALGRVVAKELLEKGAEIVAVCRTEDKLDELYKFVDELRSHLSAIKADVTDERDVESLVQKTVEKHGRIDILLNVAGAYAGGKDVANTEVRTWDFMMNVNLKSVFLCSRAVLPFMIKQNYGRIISISSRVAVENNRRLNSGAYTVSKAGVKVLTEVMAEEVKKYDINVNCVMPGTIDTLNNRRDFPNADSSKWVDPKEIADVVLFLVSGKSRVVSKAAVPVYGKA